MQGLTVRELIAALEKVDQDAPVVLGTHCCFMDAAGVFEEQNPNGDIEFVVIEGSEGTT